MKERPSARRKGNGVQWTILRISQIQKQQVIKPPTKLTFIYYDEDEFAVVFRFPLP